MVISEFRLGDVMLVHVTGKSYQAEDPAGQLEKLPSFRLILDFIVIECAACPGRWRGSS